MGQNKALGFAASRLQDIVTTNGADITGVLGLSWTTSEENYLVQKFTHMVLCMHNVDCCARVCHTPSAKALETMLGIGVATNTFDDIKHASVLLICGTNPIENRPIVGTRTEQAVLRGAQLVAADPYRTESTTLVDVYLSVRAGSNVLLLNALTVMTIEEGWVDCTFLFKRVIGLDIFAAYVAHYAPEGVAE